jgi:uncharacterized protein YndB with AHSA1/START domain
MNMKTIERTVITVDATIQLPVEKVWGLFTNAEDVMQWNSASPDWHTPQAKNDLRKGGTFSYRMEARDGSFGFDFGGVYDEVKPYDLIEYTLGDGRKVTNAFSGKGTSTKITVTFEAESTNPIDMQKHGWQAILNNFKRYAETHG